MLKQIPLTFIHTTSKVTKPAALGLKKIKETVLRITSGVLIIKPVTGNLTKGTKQTISLLIRQYTIKGDNILWFENYEVVKGDTIDKPLVNFYYNDKGQLLSKKQSRKGIVFMNDTYNYYGSDMVRAEVKVAASEVASRYDYKYNPEHLPIKKQESFIRGDKEEVYRTTYYEYKNRKLIAKKFPDYSDPRLIVEINYAYDSLGRISTAKAKCDTLYRNVQFFYNNNKLVKVTAEGNTMTKFAEVLWIYTNNYIKSKASFVFTKELFYDNKGALIKVTDKLDGVQDNTVDYVLEYY